MIIQMWLFKLSSHIVRSTKVLSIQLLLPILGLMALSGCQTTSRQAAVIPELNKSLSLLRRVVETHLPGGQRTQSSNGREYKSNYFPVSGAFSEDGMNLPERAYAHILVLGDRRPYKMEIRVYREIRSGKRGPYRSLGQDQSLAQRLAKEIREDLLTRREEMNIIDDFRAF